MTTTTNFPANHLVDTWVQNAPTCHSTFAVTNPATGEIITELPDMDATHTKQAIEVTSQFQSQWSSYTADERASLLLGWSNLIRANIETLAPLLTMEQGKPLAQAQSELRWAAYVVQTHAEMARTIVGFTHPPSGVGQETLILKQPIGVVGIITPWNFPAGISASTISAALAAGNCVVIKVSEDTPLTTAALIALAYDADIPVEAIQNITSNQPAAIGEVLCHDARVGMVSFTGSTATGRLLYRECSTQVKKLLLELGGNAPFIVFPDADIEQAASDAAQLKFKNCGQICVNANRFIIHESIYDEFITLFKQHAQAVIVGNGLDDTTTMGPLINQKGLDKVSELVNSAVQDGAKVICGGQLASANSLFYQPTILTDVTCDMRLYKEEIFGPVAACYRFQTEEQALQMANDTEYGLAAYCYTTDMARAFRLGRGIESGTVTINASEAFGRGPFGGYKASGIGRSGGLVDTLEPYLETKTLCIQTA